MSTENVNTYVILSGPALATMTSNVTYISLTKDDGGTFNATTPLCTIRRDKAGKTNTIVYLGLKWDEQDQAELLKFFQSFTSQSGGQTVVATGANAIGLATVTKAAMTGDDGTFVAPDVSLTLVAKAENGNSFRFTTEMIQQMQIGVLSSATNLNLTVSKA
jgi:hypothetical protein